MSANSSQRIDSMYCTHCTYGTSYKHQKTGKLANEVFEYGVRAASVKPDDCEEIYRSLASYLYYDLPSDIPATDRLKHTAFTTPLRLIYRPDTKRGELSACVSYRQTDTKGRPGSFFAHLLFNSSNGNSGKKSSQIHLSNQAVLLALPTESWTREDGEFDPRLPEYMSLEALAKDGMSPAIEFIQNEVLRFLRGTSASPKSTPGRPPVPGAGNLPRAIFQTEPRRLLQDLLLSCLHLSKEKEPQLVLICDPQLARILFFAAMRLLPPQIMNGFSFSTFESLDKFVERPRTHLVAVSMQDESRTKSISAKDTAFARCAYVLNATGNRSDDKLPLPAPGRPLDGCKFVTGVLDCLEKSGWNLTLESLQECAEQRKTKFPSPEQLDIDWDSLSVHRMCLASYWGLERICPGDSNPLSTIRRDVSSLIARFEVFVRELKRYQGQQTERDLLESCILQRSLWPKPDQNAIPHAYLHLCLTQIPLYRRLSGSPSVLDDSIRILAGSAENLLLVLSLSGVSFSIDEKPLKTLRLKYCGSYGFPPEIDWTEFLDQESLFELPFEREFELYELRVRQLRSLYTQGAQSDLIEKDFLRLIEFVFAVRARRSGKGDFGEYDQLLERMLRLTKDNPTGSWHISDDAVTKLIHSWKGNIERCCKLLTNLDSAERATAFYDAFANRLISDDKLSAPIEFIQVLAEARVAEETDAKFLFERVRYAVQLRDEAVDRDDGWLAFFLQSRGKLRSLGEQTAASLLKGLRRIIKNQKKRNDSEGPPRISSERTATRLFRLLIRDLSEADEKRVAPYSAGFYAFLQRETSHRSKGRNDDGKGRDEDRISKLTIPLLICTMLLSILLIAMRSELIPRWPSDAGRAGQTGAGKTKPESGEVKKSSVTLESNVPRASEIKATKESDVFEIRLVEVKIGDVLVQLPENLNSALLTLKDNTHTWNLISDVDQVGAPRIEVTVDQLTPRFVYKWEIDLARDFAATQSELKLKEWEKLLTEGKKKEAETKMQELNRIHSGLINLVGLKPVDPVPEAIYAPTVDDVGRQAVLTSCQKQWDAVQQKLEAAEFGKNLTMTIEWKVMDQSSTQNLEP